MNLKLVGATLKAPLTRAGFFLKAKSPEIALAGGIILVVGAVIATAVKSKEAAETIKEHKEELNDIVTEAENKDIKGSDTEKKAVLYRFFLTGKKLTKIYLPSILMLVLGVMLILYSHGIMKGRYAALAASYNALDRAYNEYQERVKDALGSDKEQELRYDLKEYKEKGDKGEDRSEFNMKTGPFEFFFNEDFQKFKRSGTIETDSRANYVTLSAAERYYNTLLPAVKTITLREVLEDLEYVGLETTGACWKWDPRKGDHQIDFGLNDPSLQAEAFRQRLERTILMKFNCKIA